MKWRLTSAHYIGIAVLVFVVGFFLLLPFYLGPDDLVGCGKTPDNKDLKESCHRADAIVAISGGDTPARTGEAIRLYKEGWADRLIFSGAAQDKTGPSNAQAMKQQAVFNGIPEENILIEETAVNTEENATKTQALMRDNDIHRIILVTSAYHQRRASLEFKKRAGPDVAVVNHPVRYDNQWHQNWYLTPSGWWLAMGELVKVIGFYISGK